MKSNWRLMLGVKPMLLFGYLDKEFTKEIEVNPSFNYAQIKMKFGSSRVYSNSDKTSVWEAEVNRLVNAT